MPRLSFFVSVLVLGITARSAADVVINEIHYDPEDKTIPEEFVEIYNQGDHPVDLSGWFFSAGVRFQFDAPTVLAAHDYLVIAQDPPTLAARFSVDALGPYEGRLSNSGERIVLRRADGTIADEVTYQTGFPWPLAADGRGSSMELIHPSLDNDLGGNWRASGYLVSFPEERVPLVDEQARDWHYRKGTSEASDPVDAWRHLDFVEDESWLLGETSIGYGDEDDNTVLDDMRGNYSTVYLRRRFTFPVDAEIPAALKIGLYVDDGAVVWINGVQVHRFNVADGELPFDGGARAGEARWNESFLPAPGLYLRPGENVIAIHALNARATSADFSIDARLFVPGREDFEAAGNLSVPPSPGARNSVFSDVAPPRVRQVRHLPETPREGIAVGIQAKITDPDGVSEATAHYQIVEPGAYIRLTDPEYETQWETVPMRDDGAAGDETAGDDTFSAVIPADVQVHRRLIRYRITATDGTGRRVSVPYADDTQPNFAYFVYNGVPEWRGAFRPGATEVLTFNTTVMTQLPAYHLIAQAADVNNSQYNSAFEGVHFLGTLVFDGVVHDHMEFENRGEFSTYVSGKNKWRLHFQRGHRFHARDDYGRKYKEAWRRMNLSALATPWVPTNRGMAGLGESVAFKSYDLAGVLSPNTNFFQFRVIDDAVETHPTNQYSGDLWGLYMTIEHTDGPFLDERGLPDGNTYKIESSRGDKRNQGPTQPKGSADYDQLRNAYNRAQPISWWRANVNLPEYFSFRAVNNAVNNMDLREGWNICQYHNPESDLWSVIPWDLDMLYMPLTHWSGVMNFQNCLQHATLNIEYRNRARELQDLLFTPDQFGQLVDEFAAFTNPPGEPLTFVDVDHAMWNFHPRTSGGHRGAFYRNPSTHSARGGTITRTLVSADHEGMAQWVKDFALTGYGQNRLRLQARDTRVPERPTISAPGENPLPLDAMRFQSSPFNDPDGPETFARMEWRLAEVLGAGKSPVGRESPPPYEIHAVWSTVVEGFAEEMTVPATAAKVGATYRVRVRHADTSGRWSRWSEPAEFVTAAPTEPFPEERYLRVTEIMYQPAEDSEFEFIELQNIGPVPLDLRTVRFTDGVEFDFGTGSVHELGPGEYVVVVRDELVFAARYGNSGIRVAGEYAGRLNNVGERVALTVGGNSTVLDFEFKAEWHPLTAGGGHSLVVRDPGADTDAWSRSQHWDASLHPGGSPGAPEPDSPGAGPRMPGDLNGDTALNVSDAITLLRALQGDVNDLPCGGTNVGVGGNAILADFDGNGRVGITDAIGLLNYLFRRGAPHALGRDCEPVAGCTPRC